MDIAGTWSDYEKFLRLLEDFDGGISDERCCEILAMILYGNESVVLSGRFQAMVNIARKRLNLFGGEIPNGELIPLLRQKVLEIETAIKEKKTVPVWAEQIEKEYGIKII